MHLHLQYKSIQSNLSEAGNNQSMHHKWRRYIERMVLQFLKYVKNNQYAERAVCQESDIQGYSENMLG